jgi:hypothetical protein
MAASYNPVERRRARAFPIPVTYREDRTSMFLRAARRRFYVALTLSLSVGSGVAIAAPRVVTAGATAHGPAYYVLPNKGQITFVPPKIKFPHGKKSAKQVTADNPPSQYDQNTQVIKNTCGSGANVIATVEQGFDYGIWVITPGNVNGKCQFTIQDLTTGAKGTEHINNLSN